MITIEDIVKYCRENTHARYCVFPYQELSGDIRPLEVVNPFYSQSDNDREVAAAKERLMRAPEELTAILGRLKGILDEAID